MGGNNVWGEWFDGRIDEVRIYNRALVQSEIQTDMNTPIGVADTTPPTAPTNLTANGGIGSVSLSWTASTDNVGVANYNVHRSTTPGFTPTTGNRIAQPTSTSYIDSGMPAGTYYYRVTAQDGAGNLSPASNEASGTSTTDSTPPTVSLTAPTGGATVSGTVTVSANASDNVGVVGVQFLLDGANLGAEDTTAPYSVSVGHDHGHQRHAHADRPRPRRRRQPDHLDRGHGHRFQPGPRPAWSPPTASTRRPARR